MTLSVRGGASRASESECYALRAAARHVYASMLRYMKRKRATQLRGA